MRKAITAVEMHESDASLVLAMQDFEALYGNAEEKKTKKSAAANNTRNENSTKGAATSAEKQPPQCNNQKSKTNSPHSKTAAEVSAALSDADAREQFNKSLEMDLQKLYALYGDEEQQEQDTEQEEPTLNQKTTANNTPVIMHRVARQKQQAPARQISAQLIRTQIKKARKPGCLRRQKSAQVTGTTLGGYMAAIAPSSEEMTTRVTRTRLARASSGITSDHDRSCRKKTSCSTTKAPGTTEGIPSLPSSSLSPPSARSRRPLATSTGSSFRRKATSISPRKLRKSATATHATSSHETDHQKSEGGDRTIRHNEGMTSSSHKHRDVKSSSLRLRSTSESPERPSRRRNRADHKKAIKGSINQTQEGTEGVASTTQNTPSLPTTTKDEMPLDSTCLPPTTVTEEADNLLVMPDAKTEGAPTGSEKKSPDSLQNSPARSSQSPNQPDRHHRRSPVRSPVSQTSDKKNQSPRKSPTRSPRPCSSSSNKNKERSPRNQQRSHHRSRRDADGHADHRSSERDASPRKQQKRAPKTTTNDEPPASSEFTISSSTESGRRTTSARKHKRSGNEAIPPEATTSKSAGSSNRNSDLSIRKPHKTSSKQKDTSSQTSLDTTTTTCDSVDTCGSERDSSPRKNRSPSSQAFRHNTVTSTNEPSSVKSNGHQELSPPAKAQSTEPRADCSQ